VATYSAFPLGREFPLLIVTGFIVIDLATMGAGGLLFNVVFLVLLLLAAYWFCWHTVRELTSDGENVTWRASLRSGSINVHDLVRIEPGRPPLEQNGETLVLSNGARLHVTGSPRFRPFCAQLHSARPDLPVAFSTQMKVLERLFGRRDG
jgi:hypothetical protein